MTIATLPEAEEIKNASPIAINWFNSVRHTALFGIDVGDVEEIAAAVGIQIKLEYKNILLRIKGSGGAVIISANPQITAGFDGQAITLEGSDDTATVQLQHGNGLQLSGTASITLQNGDIIKLHYNKTRNIWIETNRSINR